VQNATKCFSCTTTQMQAEGLILTATVAWEW
jgi:hypothetical protein